MNGQLIETWEINNRINLYLLDAIQQEHLKDISASKGRNVGEQFAHIHNVRLMWLKVSAPALHEKLTKIEKEDAGNKKLLAKSLKESGKAISELIASSIEKGGKVKGFKPHVAAFLGYIIAHDAHHRGQIMLCLKQSGHPVDKKIQYGLWEWGVR